MIISESLKEPSLINHFKVFRARISKEDLDLGGGKQGRWHLYYVHATDLQINTLLRQIKPGWYCHFWRGSDLVVVFRGKKFNMLTKDKSTWEKAVEYGRSIGIPKKELDFDLDPPVARATNKKATGLYQKFGFVPEGIRKKQFLIDGRYVDEVMMALFV